MKKPTIKVSNITKDYKDEKGVFNLSFEVQKGEVIGFLGPNGAGKTTVIRQLMGFVKPDQGKVTINNLDCFNKREKIVKNVGYLPGELSFIDTMTGIEFIKFIAQMKAMKDLGRTEELLRRFDLNPNIKIKLMSKGMKQKIAIICAFMNNPDILILDEPTSGLDPLMQNIFIELIKEEKSKGKTILMSSHVFEEIEKTCDKTVIIRKGKLVSIENVKELRKNKNKKIELIFNTKIKASDFKKDYFNKYKTKSGVQDKNSITITTKEPIEEILKLATKYDLIDINTYTETLEEFFMHFYKEGENNND